MEGKVNYMQTRLSLTFERPENSFRAIVHIWSTSQCCKNMTDAPAVRYQNLLKTTLAMWIWEHFYSSEEPVSPSSPF
jgi:hypothetical protein